MPRIARVVVPDYPHHITQRGNNRSDVFLEEPDRQYFLEFLQQALQETKSQLWAYCLMTNHFHLLIVPREPGALGRCLHQVTFKYAQYFNSQYSRAGRLWQNRYFSCPVEQETYLWGVARYIEKNPIRAKIVSQAENYPYSSARAHLLGAADDILSSPDWLTPKERLAYVRFFSGAGDEELIRKTVCTGRPLGQISFYKKLKRLLKRDLIPQRPGRPRKRRKH